MRRMTLGFLVVLNKSRIRVSDYEPNNRIQQAARVEEQRYTNTRLRTRGRETPDGTPLMIP